MAWLPLTGDFIPSGMSLWPTLQPGKPTDSSAVWPPGPKHLGRLRLLFVLKWGPQGSKRGSLQGSSLCSHRPDLISKHCGRADIQPGYRRTPSPTHLPQLPAPSPAWLNTPQKRSPLTLSRQPSFILGGWIFAASPGGAALSVSEPLSGLGT